jgi:hypothetical protein
MFWCWVGPASRDHGAARRTLDLGQLPVRLNWGLM